MLSVINSVLQGGFQRRGKSCFVLSHFLTIPYSSSIGNGAKTDGYACERL